MFASQAYNPLQTSLINAKTVIGIELLYEGVKKMIGKLVLVSLLVILLLPIVFLLGILLNRRRKKFQKYMKKDFFVFNSYQYYLDYKKDMQSLQNLMPQLKNVNNYDLKKTPFLVKYTLIQMQKMSSTLVTYNAWLERRVNFLNEEQFKSDNTHFKFVSETELWKNRNSAYQYWM